MPRLGEREWVSSMSEQKIRILAVDDDRDIMELIRLTLADHFDVVTLSDPVEACEIMDLLEPDVAILDVMMPKVTGYQIIEHIRKSERHKDVLAIFLSAKDTARDVKYGYKLGANVYLTKPFQPERLLKNLQALIETSPHIAERHKQHTMKEVHMRLQLKSSSHMLVSAPVAGVPQSGQSPETPKSGLKLKRVLGQEAEEAERKKWVG